MRVSRAGVPAASARAAIHRPAARAFPVPEKQYIDTSS